MRGVPRVIAVAVRGAVAALAAAVLAVSYLPAAIWPDAPVQESLANAVVSARASLWAHATDGLPLHLSLVEARCAPDGSIALVFEEHRPPYVAHRWAYAVRGPGPVVDNAAWGGGYGITVPVVDDPEFIHLMGAESVPCTAAPPGQTGSDTPNP